MTDLLTPRQRETYEKVQAYVKAHGPGIQRACNALGLNSATYGNACRRLRYGRGARWSGDGSNRIVAGVAGQVASDAEAFSCEDDELPF